METTTISSNRETCPSCRGSGIQSCSDWAGPRTDVCDRCLGIGTIPTAEAHAKFHAARAAGISWDGAYGLIR
jgi:DnaJ-class molecular chaperone